MKTLIWLSLCILPALASAQSITFKAHGKPVQTLSLPELEKLVGSETVTVHDTNENVDITYKAMPAQKILDKIYGKAWRQSEEILFTCADGYQPAVPTQLFQQYEAFLAFERVGSPQFSIINKNEHDRKVSVAPLYLIWNNLKQKGMTAGDGTSWAYQLVGMDLTTFAERFPLLAPPAKSSEAVRQGFLAFRTNCMECHSINGDGGHIGPELNYPVNVTEIYKESFLPKWIDNPAQIRFRTTMPSLPATVKDRAQTINNIILYLRAMKDHKVKPKAAGP